MRKVVQVLKLEVRHGETDLLAICEDGTIWQKMILNNGEYEDNPWMEISDQVIPEKDEDENERAEA